MKYESDRDMMRGLPLGILAALIVLCVIGTCRSASGQRCYGGVCYPPRGTAFGVRGPWGGVAGVQCGSGMSVHAGVMPPPRVVRAPVPVPRARVTSSRSPALVQVISKVGGRTRPGSGAWVGHRDGAVVLTADHCLFRAGTITIKANGMEVLAQVLGRDEAMDIAALTISQRVGDVRAFSLATEVTTGQRATIQGFAEDTSGVDTISGQIMEVANGEVHVGCQSRDGMSGGPMFNARGLVGILTSGDEHRGYWVSSGPNSDWIRQWLDSLGGPLRDDARDRKPEIPLPGPIPRPECPPQRECPVTAEEVEGIKGAITEFNGWRAATDGRLDNHEGRIAKLEGEVGSLGPAEVSYVEQSAFVVQVNRIGAAEGHIQTALEERQALAARVADLETKLQEPLFYHQAKMRLLDAEGNVVQEIEIQPKTPVKYGGTLEYVGTPREGAIIDSFQVRSGD